MNVMFVDDDPALLKATAHLLRKDRARWHVRCVESAEAALSALATEPVDLLISDLRMPRIDGLELMRRVREAYPAVIRILISGGTDHPTAHLLAHAHEVLGKPYPPEELRQTLVRVEALVGLVPDRALRERAGKCDPRSLSALELQREVSALTVAGGPQARAYFDGLWKQARSAA